MERFRTGVYLDRALVQEAKDRRVNISAIAEDALRQALGHTPAQRSTHTRAQKDQSPGMENVEKIRHTLEEMDVTGESKFTEGNLRRIIRTRIGADNRTQDKYVHLLDEMGVVEPDGFGSLKLR